MAAPGLSPPDLCEARPRSSNLGYPRTDQRCHHDDDHRHRRPCRPRTYESALGEPSGLDRSLRVDHRGGDLSGGGDIRPGRSHASDDLRGDMVPRVHLLRVAISADPGAPSAAEPSLAARTLGDARVRALALRQYDGEGGSSRPGLHVDAPAMLRDDSLSDRQTETGSAFLARVVGLEDRLRLVV